jgi:hypothetical protein
MRNNETLLTKVIQCGVPPQVHSYYLCRAEYPIISGATGENFYVREKDRLLFANFDTRDVGFNYIMYVFSTPAAERMIQFIYRKVDRMAITTKTTPLSHQQRQAIGSLLVEILNGEISEVTRHELLEMDLATVPEPYHHLVGYVRGSSASGDELARELLEELRIICVEQEK